MFIRIADLLAAEERYDQAAAELREAGKPSNWSAVEALDQSGRKSITIADVHIRRMETLREKVQRAEIEVRRIQRALGAGADATTVPTFDPGGE